MILILVRFMQIERARESWQIYHKALARFMDLPALACTFNLHEPHQNKNHSLNEHRRFLKVMRCNETTIVVVLKGRPMWSSYVDVKLQSGFKLIIWKHMHRRALVCTSRNHVYLCSATWKHERHIHFGVTYVKFGILYIYGDVNYDSFRVHIVHVHI